MRRYAVLFPSWVREESHLRMPLLDSCLRAGIAALLVPQISLLLWWIQGSTAIHFRGWINAEFFLLLALALLFPSRLLIALMTLDLVLDLVEPIAHVYYFSPADAVAYFPYILQIPPQRLASYAALAVLYLLCCAYALTFLIGGQRRPYARQLALCLTLCSLTALCSDVFVADRLRSLQSIVHVTTPTFGDSDLYHDHYAARVPAVTLAWDLRRYLRVPWQTSAEHEDSALRRALQSAPLSRTGPDIVLVLTESWGRAADDRLTDVLLKPYADPLISQRYEVQSGAVRFAGATTNGETRELCGDFRGRPNVAVTSESYSACWPQFLNAIGYQTLAVHGFVSSMYGRARWYPLLGFQKSVFLQQLEDADVPLCEGAFPGACDSGVAQWIGRTLGTQRDARPPLFVHWVTLGSHLPIPRLVGDQHPEDCVSLGIDHEPSLCSWFVHIQTVQNSVAQLALTPGLRPTIFVIVGDHAPPFQNQSIRSRFSQSHVPYLILTPRAPTSQSQTGLASFAHERLVAHEQ